MVYSALKNYEEFQLFDRNRRSQVKNFKTCRVTYLGLYLSILVNRFEIS
jgi:hypothetical protein